MLLKEMFNLQQPSKLFFPRNLSVLKNYWVTSIKRNQLNLTNCFKYLFASLKKWKLF